MAMIGTIHVQNEPVNTRTFVEILREIVVINVDELPSSPIIAATRRPRWVRESAGRR